MFASRITKVVTLPSDPSVSVTIGKLSWLQAGDARKVSQQGSARDLVAMGGAAFLKEFKASFEAPAEGEAVDAVEAPADPFSQHDTLTVLVCGVKAWSVPEPVTKATISDLEPDDAEFLAREILTLSLPAATLEADRKNAE